MEDNFLKKIMELGIGLSVARQMPDMISQSMQAANPQNRNQLSPPQIPNETVWYLIVDNAQSGPFNEETLKQIIKNNLITPETLVWRTGMSQWKPANTVPEVNKLFLLAKI